MSLFLRTLNISRIITSEHFKNSKILRSFSILWIWGCFLFFCFKWFLRLLILLSISCFRFCFASIWIIAQFLRTITNFAKFNNYTPLKHVQYLKETFAIFGQSQSCRQSNILEPLAILRICFSSNTLKWFKNLKLEFSIFKNFFFFWRISFFDDFLGILGFRGLGKFNHPRHWKNSKYFGIAVNLRNCKNSNSGITLRILNHHKLL